VNQCDFFLQKNQFAPGATRKKKYNASWTSLMRKKTIKSLYQFRKLR
jgi:hypothetical protein